MKSAFTLFVLLSVGLLHTPLSAQPSGYLGKRHVAELSLDLNPFALFDGSMVGFRPFPGVGVNYYYTVRRRTLVGPSFGFRSFGTYTTEDIKASKPTTETTLVAEAQFFGKRMYNVAPVGPSYTLGLGVLRYSSLAEDATDPSDFNSVTTGLVRLSFNYRYVLKGKYTVMPWSRFELPFSKLKQGVTGDAPAIELPENNLYLLWRTGVNVGLVFKPKADKR